MKSFRVFYASVIVALVLASQTLRAETISDNYIGADDHGYGDVIGNTSDYQINSLDAYIVGTVLHVSIDTAFAGKGDDGLFAGSTVGNTGIGYGDLFLASAWTPYGSANYANDDVSNGTIWTYGYSLDNRYMSESNTGTGSLYSLDTGGHSSPDIQLSGDFLTQNIFRDGQEVAVNTSGNVTQLANSSSWWVDTGNGTVNFEIDLAGTALLAGSELALHWAPTCANDVIEGAISTVPVPAAVWLFSSGLLGLLAVSRRRLKS